MTNLTPGGLVTLVLGKIKNTSVIANEMWRNAVFWSDCHKSFVGRLIISKHGWDEQNALFRHFRKTMVDAMMHDEMLTNGNSSISGNDCVVTCCTCENYCIKTLLKTTFDTFVMT